MKKTIDLLFNYVSGDIKKLPLCVKIDYFGLENISNENEYIIFGLYIGLITYCSVSKKLIENCFITNRLDELIHQKNKFNGSSYYDKYCENNITIGKTNLLNNKTTERLIILDDDYCPKCSQNGYVSQKNSNDNDCCKCFTFGCKLCTHYSDDEQSYICTNCDIKNIEQCIKNKLYTYKHSDNKKFKIEGNVTIDDIKKLFRIQNFKCYICDDVVLSCNWKPNCLYQFSIDRIDNNLPHNKNNVLISCYYCNCISYKTNILNCHETNKICENGCHCEKRIIKIKREDIPNEKINSLRLK